MADHTSRAGFNVRHLRHGSTPRRVSGTSTDRRRLLEEAARSVDDGWAAKQRSRNSNIRAADMGRNRLWGRVGEDGAWGEATTADDVTAIVAYGDQRAARVYRKQREESFETTTIVSHLPKSLLREIPNSYDDGRSRWTCDDATAKRYADTLSAYLAESVLTGGRDAIHAVSVHMDETVPHVHVICDTYAPDPKNEGWLRCEASQMWGQHRDVKDESGRVVSGMTKMREYQRGFRETVSGDGIEVALEPAPRSRSSMTKQEYVALQERQREVEVREGEARRVMDNASTREQEAAREKDKYTEELARVERREAVATEAQASAEAREHAVKVRETELDAREGELDAEWVRLETYARSLTKREDVVKGREDGVGERERELDSEESELRSRQEVFERSARLREDALDERQKELDEFKKELDKQEAELVEFKTLREEFGARAGEVVDASTAKASEIATAKAPYAYVKALKRRKKDDGTSMHDYVVSLVEKDFKRALWTESEGEIARLRDDSLTWERAEYEKKVARERSYSGVVLDTQQTRQTAGDRDFGG